MKKILKESITKNQALSLYKSMSESEKMSWIEAIRECIKELGYKSVTNSDIAVGVFGVGLIVMGIKLNIPELCMMGAAGIGAVAYFEKDVWEKIIECAREKKNKKNNMGIEKIKESKMKKTIRLTESELIELVQRIIKEDEMSGDSTEMSNEPSQKKFTKSSLKQLLSSQKQLSGYYGGKATNDYEYYKTYYPKVYAKVIEGRAFEPSPGGFSELRPRFDLEKTFMMKDNSELTITVETKTDQNIDTYTIKCSGGKITITGGNVGP
jgi:hypothetical protein